MRSCPHCTSSNCNRFGRFYNSDRRTHYQRYLCKVCNKTFSRRTQSKSKNQKKSRHNRLIAKLYSEGMSLRGIGRALNISYSTVFRKFKWLGEMNALDSSPTDCKVIYFDEMETIEHTKLKPLTVALAIDEKYRILGLRVGTMPAKGHLANISRIKYGFRRDESHKVCLDLMQTLAQRCRPIEIRTDKKIMYKKLIRECFGEIKHLTFKRKLDETIETRYNKKQFDPIFPINQRCGKLRSDIKRLVRRSWCTTKVPENLKLQINIYLALQNGCLIYS